MTLKNALYDSKTQKNRYVKHAHFSESKFKKIIIRFVQDLPASKIAILTKLSRPTVNKILTKIRTRLAQICDKEATFKGSIEIDESYFGSRRIKGKKGRGASGKTIVFGILERDKKVFTQIIPDCKKNTLQPIIKGAIDVRSVIYSDGWSGYNGLVKLGYSKHFRVMHNEDEFARGRAHINGIESFWSFAKRRLIKFNGISKHTFYLHLKETEFRFNYRKENLTEKLLYLFKNQPL